MSDNQPLGKPGAARGNGVLIWALAAIAGFAAVYVTLGRHDNALAPKPAAEIEIAGQQSAGGPPSTGKLTAFVVRKAPEPLPDISFMSESGEVLKLSTFKGRTVLLNLWATWCAPCREEMPSLDRLQKALGSDKFEVVALSIDRQGIAASRKFLTEVKADALKLYVDPTAKQGTILKLIGMPTTILIDREGREIGRLTGPAEWDSDDAKKLIEAALK